MANICCDFLKFCVLILIFVKSSVANNNDVCSSKDIRNSFNNLKELEGCRVIEGFLMISLIQNYNERDYGNLTFPELTEVTEFVILYRVNGLKSLANLFPNLRIIRGNSLIADYSLIIYEMFHLQEIGLKSLTQITRGAVRIEKNPLLCFVDTIDWSLITLNATEKRNIIRLNKPLGECPKCPSNDNGNGNSTNSFSNQKCWNRNLSQKVCPSHCGNRTCNEKGECCDEQCEGCQSNDTSQCLSCRYLSVGDYPQRQCVQKCPIGLYAIQNHRCVTAEDCRKFPQPINVKYDYVLPEYPYIPIEGDCTITCPSNHYPDGPSGLRVCRKCLGNACRKECPAGIIDSKAKAQQYKGCTHITGSLMISIKNQGGNIVRELNIFLSDIEEIQGSLFIVRSSSITSLSFFKNLKRIQGTPDSFGLKVVENQNLEALFPENSTVIVEHGRLFFHFNPKLCMNVINEFKNNVVDLHNISPSPDDVAPNSNGDRVACNIKELNVAVATVKSRSVLINVLPVIYEDERQLFGYFVYYKPASHQNVTIFDGRDACGWDGWSVEEIVIGQNDTVVPIFLTNLKPYTQYAYYVRTYTVASEQRGGVTKIKYFTTAPDEPEHVTSVSTSINANFTTENAHNDLPKQLNDCVGDICRKECPAGVINSKANAETYKGCTHIMGPLKISINNQGGNIERELEVFLSNIEEIQGPLTIARSYSLLSLNFFKNLKRIQGAPNSFGLKVVENENLQALFPEDSAVIVEHGRLFFHFNPKLCMNIVHEFKKNVVDLRNVSQLSPDDVAPNSNGNRVACNISELNATIVAIKSRFVLMNVLPLAYEDERQLLGYLVFYKPASYQNVTMFDGRDACGSDEWSIEEFGVDQNMPIVSIFLTHLKPYTQYAYYVRTYTVASEQRGGLTKIKYFKTMPDKPEHVQRIESSVNEKSSSEILIKWAPPARANGNLTHYIIQCSIFEEDEKLLEQRNYCNEPLNDVKLSTTTIKPADVNSTFCTESDVNGGCHDNGQDDNGSFSEMDAEQLTTFEDELHNTIYVWQEPLRRKRRDTIGCFPILNTNSVRTLNTNNQDSDDTESKMDPSGRYYRYFYTEVNGSVNSFLLTKLKHYAYYRISIKACRDGPGDNCSTEIYVYQRTLKIKEADDVTDVSFETLSSSNQSTAVTLTWKPPTNPNGLILSYVVRYQRIDEDNSKYQDSCITYNAFRDQNNTFIISEDLSNGNYSFLVGANSLAGLNMRWSKPIYKYIHNTDE